MLSCLVSASSDVGCLAHREPEAAGDSVLPSGANGLQARQEARDFRRRLRGLVSCQKVSAQDAVCLSSDGRKSERAASLSSEAAGLLRDFFKPSSGALDFKNSLRRLGKARCALSSSRSLLPLQKCASFRGRAIAHTSSEGKRKCETASCVACVRSSLRHSGRRLAQRNRSALLRSLLCRAWMLRGLRRVRCGCEFYAESAEPLRSRHPELLRPLRLHYLTQVPSAGPAPTCGACWHRASIRGFVPEPERPFSLARASSVRLLTRLSACLLNFYVQLPSRLAPSRQPPIKVRAEGCSHAWALYVISAAFSPARRWCLDIII